MEPLDLLRSRTFPLAHGTSGAIVQKKGKKKKRKEPRSVHVSSVLPSRHKEGGKREGGEGNPPSVSLWFFRSPIDNYPSRKGGKKKGGEKKKREEKKGKRSEGPISPETQRGLPVPVHGGGKEKKKRRGGGGGKGREK